MPISSSCVSRSLWTSLALRSLSYPVIQHSSLGLALRKTDCEWVGLTFHLWFCTAVPFLRLLFLMPLQGIPDVGQLGCSGYKRSELCSTTTTDWLLCCFLVWHDRLRDSYHCSGISTWQDIEIELTLWLWLSKGKTGHGTDACSCQGFKRWSAEGFVWLWNVIWSCLLTAGRWYQPFLLRTVWGKTRSRVSPVN